MNFDICRKYCPEFEYVTFMRNYNLNNYTMFLDSDKLAAHYSFPIRRCRVATISANKMEDIAQQCKSSLIKGVSRYKCYRLDNDVRVVLANITVEKYNCVYYLEQLMSDYYKSL